jgi:hypothetical protein
MRQQQLALWGCSLKQWIAQWTFGLLLGAGFSSTALAGKVLDSHGNEGYDTAAECDAAVRAGTAKFYKSFTHEPPLLREGETSVKVMTLGDLPIPQDVVQGQSYENDNYKLGACDIGVGRSRGRDGVAKVLIGKYVPYSPAMPVNVYSNKAGNAVRASMKQCDNWFGYRFPRPVPAPAAAAQPVRQPGEQCPPEDVTPPPASKPSAPVKPK